MALCVRIFQCNILLNKFLTIRLIYYFFKNIFDINIFNNFTNLCVRYVMRSQYVQKTKNICVLNFSIVEFVTVQQNVPSCSTLTY